MHRHELQSRTQATKKDSKAAKNNQFLTVEQQRFVEATYQALLKIYSRKFANANVYDLQAADVAGFAIEKVLMNVEKYLKRGRTPLHTANAIAENAFLDMLRRQRVQRGQGARNTRTVLGDVPISSEEPDLGTILENLPGEVIDPEAWIEEDHRKKVIADVQELMSELAFNGFVLTAVHGLTQDAAAAALGVSRCHLNREMRKATKQLKAMGTSYDAWGVQR